MEEKTMREQSEALSGAGTGGITDADTVADCRLQMPPLSLANKFKLSVVSMPYVAKHVG